MKNATGFHAALAAAALACVTLGIVAVALAEDGIQRPPSVDQGTYVGVDACKKCHFDSFKSWKDTKHKEAFDNLPDKYKSDTKCQECHTTGHGQEGGFATADDAKKLGGVQCEMCHGPGGKHVEYTTANKDKKDDPAMQAEARKLIGLEHAQSVCWRCHLNQTHGEHPAYDK
jgi:hypothetical protein